MSDDVESSTLENDNTDNTNNFVEKVDNETTPEPGNVVENDGSATRVETNQLEGTETSVTDDKNVTKIENFDQSPEEINALKSDEERRKSLDIEDFADIVQTDEISVNFEDLLLVESNEETPEHETFESTRTGSISLNLSPEYHLSNDVNTSSTTFSSQPELGNREKLTTENQPQIDRSVYYELFNLYSKKYKNEKRKNNIFQTELANYYKRKRMYHVLLKEDDHEDFQKQYEQTLEDLGQAYDDFQREQSTLEREMQDLRNKRSFRVEEVDKLFEKFQQIELEFSKELISSAATEEKRAVAQKITDRYLRRQKLHMHNLSKMRLEYIKLQMKYNEIQAELDSLDNLGSNIRLMDYEQAKSDNRNLSDRLEEREMQLTLIRKQCQHNMQTLAHIREKSAVLDLDIASLTERLDESIDESMDVREQLNELKQERDHYRRLISEAQEKTGLLSRPKLLRDMEDAIEQLNEGYSKLEEYKKSYYEATETLKTVKKRMALMKEVDTSKMGSVILAESLT